MVITFYRTNKYKAVDTIVTNRIYGTLEPDEMTDEDREELNNGKAEAMCCFDDENGTMHIVPWQFVISISDEP